MSCNNIFNLDSWLSERNEKLIGTPVNRGLKY